MTKKGKVTLIKKIKEIERNKAWLDMVLMPVLIFSPKEWDYIKKHGFKKLLNQTIKKEIT